MLRQAQHDSANTNGFCERNNFQCHAEPVEASHFICFNSNKINPVEYPDIPIPAKQCPVLLWFCCRFPMFLQKGFL